MLNASQPPFDNLTARQVLAYGIDRETVNEIRAANIPTLAQGPFAPGNIGYLEDAGYPGVRRAEGEGPRRPVRAGDRQPARRSRYTHAGDPETTATAQLYQELMGDIGVKVNLQPIADQSALIDAAIGGEFQAVRWRNHPGADPDTQYVWWYNVRPVGASEPGELRPLRRSRDQPPARRGPHDRRRGATRRTIYEDLNKRFAEQLWNIWSSYTIWSIASQPNVHGVLGPDLPDGSGPFPGLATGHPVSGMWVSK